MNSLLSIKSSALNTSKSSWKPINIQSVHSRDQQAPQSVQYLLGQNERVTHQHIPVNSCRDVVVRVRCLERVVLWVAHDGGRQSVEGQQVGDSSITVTNYKTLNHTFARKEPVAELIVVEN